MGCAVVFGALEPGRRGVGALIGGFGGVEESDEESDDSEEDIPCGTGYVIGRGMGRGYCDGPGGGGARPEQLVNGCVASASKLLREEDMATVFVYIAVQEW